MSQESSHSGIKLKNIDILMEHTQDKLEVVKLTSILNLREMGWCQQN